MSLDTNYKNKLEINTTPSSTETWSQINKGFSNIAEALNEVIHQTSYIGDDGWGSSEVTGGQMTFTLTGVREVGDAAQDYIFGDDVKYAFGEARKTQMKITRPDTSTIEWDITLANITESGGDANAAKAVSVTIHGNGEPILTPALP